MGAPRFGRSSPRQKLDQLRCRLASQSNETHRAQRHHRRSDSTYHREGRCKLPGGKLSEPISHPPPHRVYRRSVRPERANPHIIAGADCLTSVRAIQEVGVVSEKSTGGASVPSVESKTRTDFLRPAGRAPGWKSRVSTFDESSRGSKGNFRFVGLSSHRP